MSKKESDCHHCQATWDANTLPEVPNGSVGHYRCPFCGTGTVLVSEQAFMFEALKAMQSTEVASRIFDNKDAEGKCMSCGGKSAHSSKCMMRAR